jgi:small GTP-binding protein
MNDNDNDILTIKIALVGESGVGKTSIILRYTSDTFRSNFIPTVSASFSTKLINYKKYNKQIKFEIWDTLGQEKFRSMNRIFYKDVQAVVLTYDITRKESFIQIKEYWLSEIKDKVRYQELVIVLCATKSDLYEIQEVSDEEARNFAKENNLLFRETSSKNASGIEEMFKYIGNKLIDPNFDDEDAFEIIDSSNLSTTKNVVIEPKKDRRINPNQFKNKYGSTMLNKSFHSKTITDTETNKCKC